MEESGRSDTLLKFLALGDSYTIGEAVLPRERWPAQLVDALRERNVQIADPEIIATTGWRTDDLRSAIAIHRPPTNYDMVSLLIGVNNLYQGKSVDQYAIEFEELLRTAITLARGNSTNVFVLSIPDYGFTPFGREKQQEISLTTDAFNDVNRTISHRYGITYFDITPISREGFKKPALIAKDNLHPSGVMYSEWVRMIMASDAPPVGTLPKR